MKSIIYAAFMVAAFCSCQGESSPPVIATPDSTSYYGSMIKTIESILAQKKIFSTENGFTSRDIAELERIKMILSELNSMERSSNSMGPKPMSQEIPPSQFHAGRADFEENYPNFAVTFPKFFEIEVDTLQKLMDYTKTNRLPAIRLYPIYSNLGVTTTASKFSLALIGATKVDTTKTYVDKPNTGKILDVLYPCPPPKNCQER
jgi:hypothetical protein